MDDLFVVYRYLARNRHQTNEQNPYNVAFSVLDSYVEIQREITAYAEKIRSAGGLTYEEAARLTQHILAGFEMGLIERYGALHVSIDFMLKFLGLEAIGKLIDACYEEQERMQREKDAQSGEDQ